MPRLARPLAATLLLCGLLLGVAGRAVDSTAGGPRRTDSITAVSIAAAVPSSRIDVGPDPVVWMAAVLVVVALLALRFPALDVRRSTAATAWRACRPRGPPRPPD